MERLPDLTRVSDLKPSCPQAPRREAESPVSPVGLPFQINELQLGARLRPPTKQLRASLCFPPSVQLCAEHLDGFGQPGALAWK